MKKKNFELFDKKLRTASSFNFYLMQVIVIEQLKAFFFLTQLKTFIDDGKELSILITTSNV